MAKREIKQAFEDNLIVLKTDELVYSMPIEKNEFKNMKYKQIVSSIAAEGIAWPPVVIKKKGKYHILDGHLRVAALKELRIPDVTCLIATEDENFTYNKYVNRIANVMEHKMIKKAMENGVPAKRIAKALNIEVARIMEKKNLLNGICDEASEMLKDKVIAHGVFVDLKKVKPLRQIEMVEMMINSNNYKRDFMRAMLLATPENQITNPRKKKLAVDPHAIRKLEEDTRILQRESKLVSANYGQNSLALTAAKGYIGKMVKNTRIAEYLKENYADTFALFQKFSDADSLNGL